MEFNVIQSVAASLAGFIKGITGGAAFVQIVTFDGENIKEYNSEAIFVQDAYNLRNKLYERLKS